MGCHRLRRLRKGIPWTALSLLPNTARVRHSYFSLLQMGHFFARNATLMAFLLFALVSVCWSDFPFVAFKRWFRDLGNYLVILVVLSDPRPLEAVRTVLRRLSYLLVPLSILLNKYFPQLSKQYDVWTGVGYYVGATTSKNMLGLLCLTSGLFFFWDTMTRWPERKQQKTGRIILVNVAFFAMTLWLLHLAQSTTSSVCLVLGCLVITAAHSKVFRRHPKFLKVLIPASFCLYLILDFGFDMNGKMAGAVGRTRRSPTGRRYGHSLSACTRTRSLVPATRAFG